MFNKYNLSYSNIYLSIYNQFFSIFDFVLVEVYEK